MFSSIPVLHFFLNDSVMLCHLLVTAAFHSRGDRIFNGPENDNTISIPAHLTCTQVQVQCGLFTDFFSLFFPNEFGRNCFGFLCLRFLLSYLKEPKEMKGQNYNKYIYLWMCETWQIMLWVSNYYLVKMVIVLN